MVRRLPVLAAIMGLTIGVVSGCEGLRHALRSTSNDQASKTVPGRKQFQRAVESDPSKIQAVDADAKNPKSFFQNNRAGRRLELRSPRDREPPWRGPLMRSALPAT